MTWCPNNEVDLHDSKLTRRLRNHKFCFLKAFSDLECSLGIQLCSLMICTID